MRSVTVIFIFVFCILIVLASQIHQVTGNVDFNSCSENLDSPNTEAQRPCNPNQNCNGGHRTTAVSDCLGYMTKNKEIYYLVQLAVSGTYVLYDFFYDWRPGVVANLELFGIVGYVFVLESASNSPKVYLMLLSYCPQIMYLPNASPEDEGLVSRLNGTLLYAALEAFSTPNNAPCNTIPGFANSFIPTMPIGAGGRNAMDISTAISIVFKKLGTSASLLKAQIQNTCAYNRNNIDIAILGDKVVITEPNSNRANCSYAATTVTAAQVIQKTGFSIDALIAKSAYGVCGLATAFALQLNAFGKVAYCGTLSMVFYTKDGLIVRIDGSGCIYHGLYSSLAVGC